MKIKSNKEARSYDYRWLADLKDYSKLNSQQLDIAINGIPFRGKRYPLCYIFWGQSRWCHVYIALTKESGTQIGESIITRLTENFDDSCRAIVLLDDGRVTD